ncbi:MAG TPA: hypothetical protein VGX92_13915 [Pyrinomonadaceae bacterium]|jgi:hypothetical protein|nr:hypothetical protein [Pyrinomonadaceae bacterium]
MYRIPSLIAVDLQELRAQLKTHARNAKLTLHVIPFSADGRILTIRPADLQRTKKSADDLLDLVEKKINRMPREQDRLLAWNSDVVQTRARYYGTAEWRVFMFRWASKALPAEAFARSGDDLAKAFFRTALGIGDERIVSVYASALRAKCQPEMPRESLVQIAFELQGEQDRAELANFIIPRVALLAAGLFGGEVPLVIGTAISAIVAFLEFMQFLQDAEEDGDITEEEGEEAFWAMLGIIPFRIVQMALFVRGVGMIGVALFRALLDGLDELPSFLEISAEARENGWNSYGAFDAESTIFLPAYLFDD